MIWATLGGVTIGLALLVRHLIQWWPGLKSLRTNPLPYADHPDYRDTWRP